MLGLSPTQRQNQYLVPPLGKEAVTRWVLDSREVYRAILGFHATG